MIGRWKRLQAAIDAAKAHGYKVVNPKTIRNILIENSVTLTGADADRLLASKRWVIYKEDTSVGFALYSDEYLLDGGDPIS